MYVTENSLTDAESIALIRFASNLDLLRNLIFAVLETLAIGTKKCLSPCNHFFGIM